PAHGPPPSAPKGRDRQLDVASFCAQEAVPSSRSARRVRRLVGTTGHLDRYILRVFVLGPVTQRIVRATHLIHAAPHSPNRPRGAGIAPGDSYLHVCPGPIYQGAAGEERGSQYVCILVGTAQ